MTTTAHTNFKHVWYVLLYCNLSYEAPPLFPSVSNVVRKLQMQPVCPSPNRAMLLICPTVKSVVMETVMKVFVR